MNDNNEKVQKMSQDSDITNQAASSAQSILDVSSTNTVSVQASAKKSGLNTKILISALIVIGLVGGFATGWIVNKNRSVENEIVETAEDSVARLGIAATVIEGTVEYSQDGETWQKLNAETDLVEGDSIRAAANSRAVLSLDDGSAIRLSAGSAVTLASLVATDVQIQSNGGEVYSRVVASSTRSYTVAVGDALYKAKGTAFRTFDSPTKNGVEVFHSAVEVNTETTITEGSAYFVENEDATKKNIVSSLDVEKLKDDTFLKWCIEQDKKETEFADKLGVLTEVEKPKVVAETPPPPANTTKPVGISLSGSQDGYAANFSWSVNGVDVSSGYKLVRSKSSQTPTYPDNSVAYIEAGKSSYSLFVGDGLTYYYRICAYRGSGCVSYSNAVQVATAKKEKPQVQPGPLTLTISATTASWTVGGTAPYGFKLVMSVAPNPTYPGAEYKKYVESTSTSMFSEITDGTTYYVRVCKYTGDGCTDYSNQVEYVKP